MSSNWRRFEVLLPLQFNDGQMMEDIYFKLKPQPATADEELCKCQDTKCIYLAHKLGSNPVYCLECNGEIPPEKLGFGQEIAESIASWNGVYGALYTLWLNSGEYEYWARDRLQDREGQVNKDGFNLVQQLSQFAKTYYLWFRENYDDDAPSQCPLCGTPLQSEGYRFLPCEHCRIVI